jgi:hypothetical protein
MTEPGDAEVADRAEDPGTDRAAVAAGGAVTAGAAATGHPAVDAALDELTRIEQSPPDQQIAGYESVHRTLQETLRTIEQS